MAKSIAKQVFRASDLFELHQYYFSPPASYGDSTPVSCGLISCAVTTSEETESDSGNESDFTQDSKRRLVDTNEATSKDSAPSSNIDGIATRPKNDNNQSSSVRGKSEYPSQLGKSPRHFRDADLTNSPSFKDRPKKKPVNRQTMPRIAYYPKIKVYRIVHR